MIKFKQKKYTIPEGHYTGPKDMEDIPGVVSTVLKGSGVGAVVGGVTGSIMKDSTITSGALTGAKYGALGGLVAKLLLNYIHKPMSSIKYQEVDKSIRRQFGIYQMSGFTVGDSLSKRATLDEKFSFNDRDVSKYKINFAIHNNQVTMYTFGMTKEELDEVSKVLDYYCKKYYAMEYSATIINQKVNSYSVNITFTNYMTISQFIMEISEKLNTKINLLDNNMIVVSRLIEESEKTFSISRLDLGKIIHTGVLVGLVSSSRGRGFNKNVASITQSIVTDLIDKEVNDEKQRRGISMNRNSYNNELLKSTLKKLHYIDGFHYTTGSNDSDFNMSITGGVLIVTVSKEISEKIDQVWKHYKTKMQRKDLPNKIVLYGYPLTSLGEFENLLRKIMSLGEKPNIYEKVVKLFSDNRLFSNINMENLINKLNSEKITDFEVDDRIPDDVISISCDNLNSIVIYVPTDLDYAQYDIEDTIRELSRFTRVRTEFDRNKYILKIMGSLTFNQLYKLVKTIIDEEGFCTILKQE